MGYDETVVYLDYGGPYTSLCIFKANRADIMAHQKKKNVFLYVNKRLNLKSKCCKMTHIFVWTFWLQVAETETIFKQENKRDDSLLRELEMILW